MHQVDPKLVVYCKFQQYLDWFVYHTSSEGRIMCEQILNCLYSCLLSKKKFFFYFYVIYFCSFVTFYHTETHFNMLEKKMKTDTMLEGNYCKASLQCTKKEKCFKRSFQTFFFPRAWIIFCKDVFFTILLVFKILFLLNFIADMIQVLKIDRYFPCFVTTVYFTAKIISVCTTKCQFPYIILYVHILH